MSLQSASYWHLEPKPQRAAEKSHRSKPADSGLSTPAGDEPRTPREDLGARPLSPPRCLAPQQPCSADLLHPCWGPLSPASHAEPRSPLCSQPTAAISQLYPQVLNEAEFFPPPPSPALETQSAGKGTLIATVIQAQRLLGKTFNDFPTTRDKTYHLTGPSAVPPGDPLTFPGSSAPTPWSHRLPVPPSPGSSLLWFLPSSRPHLSSLLLFLPSLWSYLPYPTLFTVPPGLPSNGSSLLWFPPSSRSCLSPLLCSTPACPTFSCSSGCPDLCCLCPCWSPWHGDHPLGQRQLPFKLQLPGDLTEARLLSQICSSTPAPAQPRTHPLQHL